MLGSGFKQDLPSFLLLHLIERRKSTAPTSFSSPPISPATASHGLSLGARASTSQSHLALLSTPLLMDAFCRQQIISWISLPSRPAFHGDEEAFLHHIIYFTSSSLRPLIALRLATWTLPTSSHFLLIPSADAFFFFGDPNAITTINPRFFCFAISSYCLRVNSSYTRPSDA